MCGQTEHLVSKIPEEGLFVYGQANEMQFRLNKFACLFLKNCRASTVLNYDLTLIEACSISGPSLISTLRCMNWNYGGKAKMKHGLPFINQLRET
jgi:hypothetical protein